MRDFKVILAGTGLSALMMVMTGCDAMRSLTQAQFEPGW